MDILSIPDLAGMLILMGVLAWLRPRHQAEHVDFWLIGLSFILTEALAVAIYRGSSLLHAVMHTIALDAYVLAAVTFGWAAGEDLLPGRRRLPVFVLPAVPLLTITSLYGSGVRQTLPYLIVIGGSLILGICYICIWAERSLKMRGLLIVMHLGTWTPAFRFAQHGSLRAATYWGLACFYVMVAVSFRGRIRRKQIGGLVIVTSFVLWAACFLLHVVLYGRQPWDKVVDQVWNLQKFFVILGMILTLLESESEQRRAEAMHDALTKLPNRRLFDDRLTQALERCLRSGKSTALFVVDLDNFKAVNDTLGHSAGDMVLKRAADALQLVVRTSDTLARCGGDEFCIVVNDLTRRVDCTRIAQSLCCAIEQMELPQGSPSLAASVGFAMFPDDAADSDELYRLADRRMYQHKRGEITIEALQRRSSPVSVLTERRAR